MATGGEKWKAVRSLQCPGSGPFFLVEIPAYRPRSGASALASATPAGRETTALTHIFKIPSFARKHGRLDEKTYCNGAPCERISDNGSLVVISLESYPSSFRAFT
jgi:hypothetical protein